MTTTKLSRSFLPLLFLLSVIVVNCCFILSASASDSAVLVDDDVSDVCEGVSCGHGRTCVASGATPTCQCARSCPPHAHPVCGTDSAWYPNHCELHRHACMLGKAISIDHTEKSCKVKNNKKNYMNINDDDNNNKKKP